VTLGISDQGKILVNRLGLLKSDLNILMPVRVTQAKNIEFALQVVAVLKQGGLHPMLVVTGPPDPHDSASMQYYQSLRDLRAELGLEDQMRFIFESSPQPEKPFFIDEQVVGDLYRLSDVMFMPSHREGFGMPVLEAGLTGVPVVSRDVPAAAELAGGEATIFSVDTPAEQVAAQLVHMLERSPTANLRRRVRRQYTWRAIFENDIQPLLQTRVEN
jgi:glycosyltransferase involved in cell wall biosynthesis